ncbi:hypothetical protein VCUG_01738 [Vavraia culicis subsp. floridensis]|uniref:60S ribosomal export protein NMD3 n=1 Tax=Vavraia culicis (isolate floridensis) TaxID=948595 RepID=L2GT20_VAVCU|nr:uncharacterized protein VCUG_01738 [Vavraia culicis subsp. floridensis]ELA46779.1 hypothetical protein VCUG_01738 [Vavraia culicis subsp. floridensis]
MDLNDNEKYEECKYSISCCKCGISILPNCLNMCTRCRSAEIDITEGIKLSYAVESCKKCNRYLLPPKKWIVLENETDLLSFLLLRHKEIRNLNIVDSGFKKTEEHSRRIILELEIAKDELRCNIDVVFKIRNKQCPDCDKMEAKQYWTSIVQIRQRSKSKRTFLYLEQSILKHKMYKKCTNIKERKDGIDFYYLDRHSACEMVNFLEGAIGTKLLVSNRLMTEDRNNNKMKYKFSYSVEIFPLCKDDLVVLSEEFAKKRNISRLMLVLKVSRRITLVDPVSSKTIDITNKCFWSNRECFNVVMTSKDLTLFRVTEVERDYRQAFGTVETDKWGFKSVDCFVTREYNNDVHCKSHLGSILNEDDEIYGYDLGNCNLHFIDRDLFKAILVRKNYKNLNLSVNTERERDREYEFFLEDVFEDDDLKKNVDLYDRTAKVVANLDTMKL